MEARYPPSNGGVRGYLDLATSFFQVTKGTVRVSGHPHFGDKCTCKVGMEKGICEHALLRGLLEGRFAFPETPMSLRMRRYKAGSRSKKGPKEKYSDGLDF